MIAEIMCVVTDEKCFVCVSRIQESVIEFDLDPSETDLSRLPNAEFVGGSNGSLTVLVCASHLSAFVRSMD